MNAPAPPAGARRWRLATGQAGSAAPLRAALDSVGWEETAGDDWRVLWAPCELSPQELAALPPGRRVNRLPGLRAIGWKDRLARNLRAMAENHGGGEGNPFDFHPVTYVFPEDYQLFRECLRADPSSHWLLKPADRSQGRGIQWATLENLSPEAGWVAQRYIGRPCLADGRKFILRFYLLLENPETMALWSSRTPQVKLCRTPFSSPHPGADLAAHLTNHRFQNAADGGDAAEVSWSWDELVGNLAGRAGDTSRVIPRCHSILYRTVMAGREEMLKRMPPGAGKGFELLGVDIALDEDLTPWLLECNYAPALFWSPQTVGMKTFITDILADTFDIVTSGQPGKGVMVPVRDEPPAAELFLPGPSVTRRALDGETSLHSGVTGRIYSLNPTAAMFWEGIADGLPVREISGLMSRATGEPEEMIAADLRRQLADWHLEGLVRTEGGMPQDRLHFSLLGRTFTITGCPDLLERLRGVLPPAGATAGPDEILRVAACPGYVMLQHGPVRRRCLDEKRLLSLLRAHLMLWAINHGVPHAIGAMHAASFLATDGGLLLLAGPSGSGKSTLSAALRADGALCHGDDVCLVRADLLLQPLPVPIAIRQGGRDALFRDSAVPLEGGKEAHCLEGLPLLFLPCVPSPALPLRAIVLATHVPGADRLEALPAGIALRLILKGVLQSEWLQDSHISRLAHLLQDRTFRMEFSSPSAAVRMLRERGLVCGGQ